MDEKKNNAFQKYVINNPRGIFDVRKKKDFWKKLAEDIDAEFKIITTVSRDLNKLQIKYSYNNCEILITETDTKPLFIETNIPYRLEKKTYFQISENEFIDRLLSRMSSNMMKLNHTAFDKKFLIKSSDKYLVNNLLSDNKIIEALIVMDVFYIEGSMNIRKNNFNLKFNVNRVVNSYDYLKSLLFVFCYFIDRIEKIGSPVIKSS